MAAEWKLAHLEGGKIANDVISYDRNNLIPINGHAVSYSFDFVRIFQCTHTMRSKCISDDLALGCHHQSTATRYVSTSVGFHDDSFLAAPLILLDSLVSLDHCDELFIGNCSHEHARNVGFRNLLSQL